MPAPDLDVRYVAKLARLALTEEEAGAYGAQLINILEHVSALGELDTSDVAATAQVVESRNAWREDELSASLPREEVLAEAPRAQGAYFRVPRIIGEGT